MRVFLRVFGNERLCVSLEESTSCSDIRRLIADMTEEGVDSFNITAAGRVLGEGLLTQFGVDDLSSIDVVPKVIGGGTANKNQMDPAFQVLADKYNIQKKVCRQCYATTHPKAFTCR